MVRPAIARTREVRMKAPLAASFTSCLLLACGGAGEGDTARDDFDDPPAMEVAPVPDEATPDSARANIVDTRGVGIGAVIITAEGEGVALRGALIGLPPGEHGFHIHHTGNCEPPAFESAGDHLGAGQTAHGFDAPGGPHAGDLRNITVDEDSTASVDQTDDRVTLRGESVQLLDDDGSAIVIHAGPDDYVSQPSGDSGDRIACGVIEG
jgi:Cu-Zn family superoxide dismutase